MKRLIELGYFLGFDVDADVVSTVKHLGAGIRTAQTAFSAVFPEPTSR